MTHVKRAYRDCHSYRDEGVSTTRYHLDSGRIYADVARFSIAFIRPDRFRCEAVGQSYYGKTLRSIAWCAGRQAMHWTSHVSVQKRLPIGIVMADLKLFAPGMVASLLLPRRIGRQLITDLRGAVRLADEEVEGQACFRLQGVYNDHRYTLWIDRETYLLRQTQDDLWGSASDSEETIRYFPSIDGEIREDELAASLPTAD